jgi:8-oxo-dGTP pyrophosphatase MutT (NUDIX family)
MLLKLEYPFYDFLQKINVFPWWLMEQAAFALIKTRSEDTCYYLLQWNPKWQCYNFIGGKVETGDNNNDNDFSRTLCREIEEEMGIEPGKIEIEQEARLVKLWQYSAREKRFKPYLFSIFTTNLFSDLPADRQKVTRALRWLSSKYENAYVSQAEIINLQAADGKPISATVRRILIELREIEPN